MNRPLEGIRLCDVTQNLAGPFCCQILGDLGAEVIKIEPPGGDSARRWGPPFWGEDSTLFLSVNRNKRSVVLDLKSAEGREVLHQLAGGCDIFVQASRAGVPERRGYDYGAIRSVRPDVIYMSVSAYGDRGPLRDAPGYDPLMQAFSGIMSLTGFPGEPPARVGGSVVDFGTGMWAAIAILAALRQRDLTGEGAALDTALLDTSLGWISYHLMGFMATGIVPGPMGTALESIVPYQAFATLDGHVMISAGSEAIFGRLMAALGLEEVGRDPRFRTNPLRVSNRTVLIPAIETVTQRMTTAALTELMRVNAVPASPIRNLAEVVADSQVAASEMIASRPHDSRPDYREIALPFRMGGERPSGSLAPPTPGQHTVEVLLEAGLTPGEIERLIEIGAIRSGKMDFGTADPAGGDGSG